MKNLLLTTLTATTLMTTTTFANDCGYIESQIVDMKNDLVKMQNGTIKFMDRTDKLKSIDSLKDLIKETEKNLKECNDSVHGLE